MNMLPQIEKISVFRADTERVINNVKEGGPVLLMQRSDPAVVLVSPDFWDDVAQRLSYLERIVRGDAAKARMDAGGL